MFFVLGFPKLFVWALCLREFNDCSELYAFREINGCSKFYVEFG